MDSLVNDWRCPKWPFNNWKHLLSTGLFSDVQITVKDKGRVKMISPVFEAMLSGYFVEKNEILIEDVDHDVFQTFFDFMYSLTLTISDVTHAWDVYELASRYIVEPVREYCINYIKVNCNIQTCCINYNYAEFFGLEDIKRSNYEFMMCNIQSIFLQPEFLSLSKTAIASMVSEPVLCVNESHLFNNLEKWIHSQISLKEGKKEKKRLCKLLTEELVKKIHFLEMTPTEFANAVGSSQFLTQPEKLSIFMYLCGTNKELPLDFGIQKFDKKLVRISNINCRCQGSMNSCAIDHYDLYKVKFIGSSYLTLRNVLCGAHGTTLSFCFRLNSQSDATLFHTSSCTTSSSMSIQISNKKLSVTKTSYSMTSCSRSYRNTTRIPHKNRSVMEMSSNSSINFENEVTDGLPHIILLSFCNNYCKAKLDGVALPNDPAIYLNNGISTLLLGSPDNESEANFCISSLTLTFRNNSTCINMKDYHSEINRINVCRCLPS